MISFELQLERIKQRKQLEKEKKEVVEKLEWQLQTLDKVAEIGKGKKNLHIMEIFWGKENLDLKMTF